MTLSDVLQQTGYTGDIMYRIIVPIGNTSEDMLFGYAHWDGWDLTSLDGDSYDVEERISKYHTENGMLVVYIPYGALSL